MNRYEKNMQARRKDCRILYGESVRAFRTKWPRKKKNANQAKGCTSDCCSGQTSAHCGFARFG
jgi:hypothetical protein